MAKKIRLWSILLCVLACLCFGVAFSFVPKAKADEASNPEKVVVLSPENSENFSSLVQKTGGGLTEVDGETVYDSKGWYGFSYNQIVSEYTATIEFKTSDSGSDLRIYINSATIGGAMDYVFRFYQGYLMVYEPEKTDKRNWNTSSNFIFKTTPANYRNGEWHTFTINLYKGQFFVTMDGQFIPNTNNMKNPDKYSDTTNHMYTNMIKDAETGVSSEVEIDEGYVGIYGKDFYVRTFEVDLYDTDESVGKKQFATSHQVYADIKTASTAGYSEEQFNSILALGQNAISEINLAVTENEVAAAYANFTKRVESLGFVYEYDFSSSASGASDFTLSGGTLTTENGVNTITAGSSWTVANYNGGWEHYAQFTATMNLGVSSGDVRVYFYTNPEENEGYLLRFYAGMTILYQSPFEGTADYWNYPQNGSGVIKRSDINFQDGKDHVISFAFYENQFYLTLDGEFFNAESVFDTGFADNVYTKTDGEGNGVNYSYFSFSFAGTNFTVKNAETTCYGLMEEVGSKQFENVFAIYEHIEGLDKHLYGGNSWSEVLAVANSYVGEIVASYDEEPSQIDGLLAEAISAINAVEPVLTFDINEDFEDGTNDEISVKSGTNSVMGTENNRYLSVSSTWNVFSTNEITKDYILSFDFRAGTEKALYFNFNTQVANGSRVNCYSVRLYASGASQSVQLYKGVESEGNLAWIYTHASSTYYRDDNWHNLKVISADGKFTLYLDDTNIVPTSKSNNYTMDKGVLVDESFKMGYFGMQSQAPVDIDNFSVQPVESFEDAVYTLENTEGTYYFQELNEIPSVWTVEGGTLLQSDNSISALKVENGSLALTKEKSVYSAHLALTFKGTDFSEKSVLQYLYATKAGQGYRLDITPNDMTLVLLNKDGSETAIGNADFTMEELCTVRFLQYGGYTYVYCDDVQKIAVENTDYYQGDVSVNAENMTVEIYKLILSSSENTEIATAESLPITLSLEELGDRVLLGFRITGGGYDGLYNVDDEGVLEYEYGMIYTPVTVGMYMKMGASARIHTDAGLRWTTYISAEEYEELSALGVTFGTRITSVGSEKYKDIPLVNGLNEGDGEYYWNGALVNILTENYERIFLGTGYAYVTYADGETALKFAENDDNYRTYKGVAFAALNDVSETQTEEYKYLVELENGEKAYSSLKSDKYDELKDIYEAIEAKLGQTVVKSNEWDDEVSMHVIDVCYTDDGDDTTEDYTGNALSVLIEYQDQVILVDAGTGTESSVTRVIDFLEEEGVQRIDHLILTHEHKDHAGGMSAVAEQFDVGTFYSRPMNVKGEHYVNVENTLFSKVNSDGTTVKFEYPNEEGWRVSLSEDTYFEFYNCTRIFDMQDVYTDGNYFSLEVLFVSGEATAFFGGDAVGLTQNEEMVNVFPAYDGIDVYQVQHHGTGGAYSPKVLVDALKPTYTIVPTSGVPADIVYEYSEPYGRTYVTGYVGTSSFDIGENGKFVMRADDENRWADCQRVSVTGTELEYDGSNRTNGANIVGDRGLYIVPAYGKATALVYTVPENVTEPTVITLRGSDVFRKEEGTGNIRFRIILNDRVLYTGDCSVAQENLDVNLRFTVKAGDKIYFAVDCTTEENSNTAVYMTSAIYIDGMYLDASKCNHVNPANSTKACEKNFFNGVLYNGERYTYADIFSYEAIEIKEIA